MKRIAIVCSPGVGDALIFHIAAHHLQTHGYSVTTFSDHLPSFGDWLKGFSFESLSLVPQIPSSFDMVFLQHANDSQSKTVQSFPIPVYSFYGSHNPEKHRPLLPDYDFLCDPNRTVVANLVTALQKLFKIPSISKENGLTAPTGLIHRHFKKRVAIHATSSDPQRNWPMEKFTFVSEWLKNQGYDPVILPHFSTLKDLASFIYESGFFLGNDSGPGHLASYLQIPHLIIGKSKEHMCHWKPGWAPGEIVTPPSWLPNWKGFRLKKNHWKTFITKKTVINRLKNKVLNN